MTPLKLSLLILLVSSQAFAAKHKKAPSVPVFEVKDESGIVLKTTDVENASVTGVVKGKDESAGIFIELKSSASKRFKDYTRNHIGKKLTVFIDGKEVASPEIKTEIESGHLAIDAKMSADEADAVADKINAHSKR